MRTAAVAGAASLLMATSALAECETTMNHVPMAGSSPVPSTALLRAHMVRVAPAAAPKPKASARPRATQARSKARVGKARPHRKPAAHRAQRRAAPVAVAAAVPPVARPVPWAASREAPRAYALISTTVCGNAPTSAVPLIPLPNRASMLRSPDDGGVIPPTEGPFLVTGTPTSPGTFIPGTFIPDTGIPLTPGPGIYPPGTPPGPSPTGAVPEPGTWALLILGFGAVGARLRRRRRQAAL